MGLDRIAQRTVGHGVDAADGSGGQLMPQLRVLMVLSRRRGAAYSSSQRSSHSASVMRKYAKASKL